MKILNLQIESPNKELIRDIPFNETGTSIIFGEISEPKNKLGTSNSLGKTLLLRMIEYVLGAEYSSEGFGAACEGYTLMAAVKHEGRSFKIKRAIGSDCPPSVDGVEISLMEYKGRFNITRSEYTHQINLSKRPSLFSGHYNNLTSSDAYAFLSLLEFDSISDTVRRIYQYQDEYTDVNKSKKELAKLLGIDGKPQQVDAEISKQIFYNDKDVETSQQQLQNLDRRIASLDISDTRQNLQEEYEKNAELVKGLTHDIEMLKSETHKLNGFIDESTKSDISSKEIALLFSKAKQEIPDIVIKTLTEVEAFHKKVFEERSQIILSKVNALTEELSKKEQRRDSINIELTKLGKTISENRAYQEALGLYQEASQNLQNALFQKGRYEQLSLFNDKLADINNDLNDLFSEVHRDFKEYATLVSAYQEFVFNLSEQIYGNNRDGFFEITLGERHVKRRPLKLTLELQGDSGEGVGAAKACIIDALVFRFNKKIELLIQDSSCYSGMDPRQIHSLIKAIESIALEENKQAIIAINRFQIQQSDTEYDEQAHQYYEAKSVITLSENDKLLRKTF